MAAGLDHASGDAVVIMDADNVTTPNFLAEINRAFESGLHAVQAHRTGKNMNTDIAVLDAISEEINNGFFRSGHNAIGLSAGLAGSGMAFDVHWFRRNVGHLQTSGEDKELEALLLKQRIHIEYLEQLPVYDEKTQKKEGIKNQRKRWIAAQYGALRASLPDFPKALIQGNIDYCDKILQWMLPPRLIQLAGVFGFTLLFTAIGLLMSLQSGGYEWYTAIKWWILSAAQVHSLCRRAFSPRVPRAPHRLHSHARRPLRELSCRFVTAACPFAPSSGSNLPVRAQRRRHRGRGNAYRCGATGGTRGL